MIELHVDGMSCGGCAARVTKSIQALDQAAKVEVDLRNKKVKVETAASAQALASAVTSAGYPAAVQSA